MITVIGAGLAGLSCAVALLDSGQRVTLLEAAPAAGGRCRSYDDRELGCRLDNGNHLLLSGNRAAHGFLQRLGTADTLAGPGAPMFPFLDLATGERWVLQPGRGLLPFWLLSRRRRVPGTRVADYLSLARWLRVPAGTTVAAVGGGGALYRRLIEPLAISALNTLPEQGDATLMAAVVRQTLLRGGAACIPAFPATGLSESLVDPALALLAAAGQPAQLGRRVNGLRIEGGRVRDILTSDGPIPLAPGDGVVLAVPAGVAATLLPGLTVPDAFEAIINLHFRIDHPPGRAGFLGLVGGLAEWLFFKPGIISVTISAANRHADLPPDTIAARVWAEIARACAITTPMPVHRLVREKRATFAATPTQERRRPDARVHGLANLALAGDWTRTGLPATIEGSVRSGLRAAALMGTA